MAIFAIEDASLKAAARTLPTAEAMILFGLGGAALACLALTLKTLARLPERAQAAPHGHDHTPLQPLSWALAAYACFGVGYIAYMTFIVAFLRQVGSGGLVTPFWALLRACVFVNPFVWGPLAARARGARAPRPGPRRRPSSPG